MEEDQQFSQAPCEELLYDLEQENNKLKEEVGFLRDVLDKANKLTDIEWAVVETAIEAVYHPKSDGERVRMVGKLLDDLFASVKRWRARYRKPATG